MIRWIIFLAAGLWVIAGCAGPAGEAEPSVESQAGSQAATAVAPTSTPQPSATPIPSPPPTITRRPTLTPIPTTTPEPTTTPLAEENDTASALDQIWLPFGFGAYGDPLLAVKDGQLLDIAEPDEPPIEAFFDSHPSGRILYGAEFWYPAANAIDSVTDLWLAEKAFEGWGPPVQILEGEVGRAAFNPASEIGWPLAVAVHNGVDFDLVLQLDSETRLVAAESIEPFFSWAPDGSRLAFVKNGRLFLLDPKTLESISLEANLRDAGFGWVGDEPVWDLQNGVIFYPAGPILVIPLPDTTLDHDLPFVPLLLDDEPLFEDRPSAMLWSIELEQLIVQQEDLIPEIQIFLLTSDLAYVEDIYFLENATLVGWYVPGRSIIVIDDAGDPAIWDLERYEFIKN